MLKAGIIDPVKVTRTALQNAASAAAVLLTTEAAVSEIPKEKSPMPPMPGGMGGWTTRIEAIDREGIKNNQQGFALLVVLKRQNVLNCKHYGINSRF